MDGNRFSEQSINVKYSLSNLMAFRRSDCFTCPPLNFGTRRGIGRSRAFFGRPRGFVAVPVDAVLGRPFAFFSGWICGAILRPLCLLAEGGALGGPAQLDPWQPVNTILSHISYGSKSHVSITINYVHHQVVIQHMNI